jgi:hypothetical protein
LALISFACQEFGWRYEYVVEEVSVTVLLLLMRQRSFAMDPANSGFSLAEQEQLDSCSGVSWDELVRRNREQLMRQMKT